MLAVVVVLLLVVLALAVQVVLAVVVLVDHLAELGLIWVALLQAQQTLVAVAVVLVVQVAQA
jgi:hypothetical protein